MQHEIVKLKFIRNNWSDDLYRLNVFALGEVFKRILNLEEKRNSNGLEKNLSTVKNLIKKGSLNIVNIDDFDTNDLTTHINEIKKLDTQIENGDVLNLAIFCSDHHAKYFYTLDTKIIRSNRLSVYLNSFNKKIRDT